MSSTSPATWRRLSTHAFTVGRQRGVTGRPTPGALARGVRALRGLGVLGRPPAPPASQARIRGRLHSPLRDRQAISHHYDLSNDFYALILDPPMAYSCAYYGDDPGQSVASAQRAKLDLVCRKLGLDPAAGSSTSAVAGARSRSMPPSTSAPASPA